MRGNVNGQQTATVETLTAEVRVLMVGSRQVTLSVAKQLDVCPLSDMTPFGRVSIVDPSHSAWHLIGRHKESGVLSLASLPHRLPMTPWIGNLPRAVTVCRVYGDNATFLFEGRSIHFDGDSRAPCQEKGHYSFATAGETPRCEHWHTNGMDQAIRVSIEVWDAQRAEAESFWAMPLIILAGLK